MKKKRIAMLLVATLTFSQSMGAVIPVAAEELTADTGQETAETEESEEIVQENDASETTGEAASVPDLEDDEELSLQDDAENAEEEIAEENTSETTELLGITPKIRRPSVTVQKLESLLKQMNNISLI